MDMLKRLLFVVNRHAGKNRIVGNMTNLLEAFSQKGFLPTVHVTRCQGDGTEIVRQLGGDYPLVICSGGDGTLSEVIAGVMEFEPADRPIVGYIPAGSTNDYAATVGLPNDMLRCAEIITEGHILSMDVGNFNGKRAFVYVAAFGTFTEASYATPQRDKNLLGYNAYILHGLKELANLRFYEMDAIVDGKQYSGRFLFGMVSNANSVGGLHHLSGTEAIVDDGLFEFMLVRAPETAAEWPQLLSEVLSKKNDGRYVITGRAKSIEFVCKESIDWVLDGEYGGKHQRATVEVLHRAVQLVAPSAVEV